MSNKTHSTRRGRVLVEARFAGTIEEHEGDCVFTYDADYLKDATAPAVSLTLPKRPEPFREKNMIPFFDGLIPEGWLLDIITDNWKLDRNDRLSLLLLACRECIGNVSVVPEE